MFKKQLCLMATLMILASLMFTSGAFALNYSGSQENAATFETLEETRVNSPSAVANLETNVGKAFKSHPVLDGYPQGTTYVYRSANLFGGRAAARLNTNILLFAAQSFADKDTALAYLKSLGLIDIIEEAVGSVILVTPSDPKAGFTAIDQKYYYALQTAMLSQKAFEKIGDVTTYYSDAEYFGGYGYLYVIGIDGGATYFNNCIASSFDFASRIAGVLLLNSKMDEIRKVASILPAYLVNATENVVAKYKAANETDSIKGDKETTTYFNQTLPLQQVIISNNASADITAVIKEAYNEMFIKSMRVPVIKQGLYSSGTPYQGYNFDEAPYSLCDRNPIVDGVTLDGISLFMHQEDRFCAIKTEAGEYLQTWFEYIPNEVIEGKVPNHSVPLILANHGSGDDPRLFVDEIGWLSLIGQERFIIAAPEHQYIEDVRPDALAALITYMIDTYPAIDPTRVYATGYSMGGRATVMIATSHPQMLAAAVCMSGPTEFPEEYEAQFTDVDLPFLYTTSGFDSPSRAVDPDGNLMAPPQKLLNKFLMFNEMDQITYDFDKHPMVGFEADIWSKTVLNNEYNSYLWFLNNKQNVPMVGVSYTKDLIHALYPEYSKIAWNYMKHFSRNLETGAVQYNPYIK